MNSTIKEKKDYLLHWMYDFIEDDEEPAYLAQHVEECDQLITAFIHDVTSNHQNNDFSWVSTQIESLVKKLNDLNFKLDHQLIETDQREDICALIKLVVQSAGHEYSEDITERWRTW
ncbi:MULTISPECIES: hypothetical protein [unclassified Oleiphilus]|jgi:hypothetical protein|uniref:hypothetical protein n=3 Tax=Oleiphilus TaxID=141450 RepID=UPI0007C3473C|nr:MULTISPECIES: hypothetical protein [unclassified Oleiphilus]KZY51543.1 hypothetical protein A3732_00485 [Oleiphilus sp. HI0050]KZY77392.1 hypothetical protein A3740_10500 [Oleiphilus sp. HI0068]KZY84579.1 hypothetical protein A3741_29375 [Oleiphilus sp. HI0069]KZY88410.1 hypothetical protein A3743_11750 [Oleiphilus sp. HI0072]KZZ10769.1 hypothetical protein A3749_10455 [Oleiphilus sp. HI0078]KZZ30300.1 hypothetical protein A3752_17250 [Oleiphilus sp. HI0081]KZZ47036.1 hypothetical protein